MLPARMGTGMTGHAWSLQAVHVPGQSPEYPVSRVHDSR